MQPTVTLTVTQQDLDLIVSGLGQLKYHAVAELFAKLQKQVEAQAKPVVEEPQSAVPA